MHGDETQCYLYSATSAQYLCHTINLLMGPVRFLYHHCFPSANVKTLLLQSRDLVPTIPNVTLMHRIANHGNVHLIICSNPWRLR